MITSSDQVLAFDFFIVQAVNKVAHGRRKKAEK